MNQTTLLRKMEGVAQLEQALRLSDFVRELSLINIDPHKRLSRVQRSRMLQKRLFNTKLSWCKEVWSDRHFTDCVGIWQIQKGKLDEKYIASRAKALSLTELIQKVRKAELPKT